MPLYPDSLYCKDPIEFFKSHDIFNCMINICDGLIQLHSINIIHGNIKPSNILITDCDNYVLTDYCKNQLYDLSDYLPVITTYRYTAPEVFLSKEYNIKSDMWSYGCLLHFLFSSKNAFDKLDFSSLKSDIISGNYTSKVLYYTEYVNVLLTHLINVNPENRISSLELRNALDIFKEEISKPVVINAKYTFDQCFEKEATKRNNDEIDLRKNKIKKEKYI